MVVGFDTNNSRNIRIISSIEIQLPTYPRWNITARRILPGNLAENLSSKRTNHKLAEQGRRNRINHALKEIETLIPEDFAQMRTAKEAAACNVKPSDKEKEKAGNQAISKASTVEMAIDYIKALQMELKTTRTKLAGFEEREAKSSESAASDQ